MGKPRDSSESKTHTLRQSHDAYVSKQFHFSFGDMGDNSKHQAQEVNLQLLA
jgi:hypothetical protein